MVITTAKKTQGKAQTLRDVYNRGSLGWQRENLMIVNKQSQLVPLDHNIAQRRVAKAMALQIDHGLPVMLLIYKARQEGISTFIEACLFEMMNRNKNWHASVVSMDKISTSKVFRMCEVFQEEMPKDKKILTDRCSEAGIRFSKPHRSSLLCQTAGAPVLGRGGTGKGVHATEVTYWPNAKRQLLGLLQEIPDEPDTITVLETTANGPGNEFSKEYWAAVKRLRGLYKIDPKTQKKVLDPTVLRGYLPIFLSWQDFPEYRVELPVGCKEVPGMTPEAEDYVKEGLSMGISLDPEQIYFALLKCTNKCSGDWDLFKQEYPRTAREAERATGRMVFRPMDIDHLETYCKKPIAYVEFYEEEPGQIRYRNVTRTHSCWAIWKWPIKNHSYVGFCDVAEGILSDPNDPKSDPDRSVAAIMSREMFDFPAVYYGRPDTVEFGDQFVLGCSFFNWAWASPEMNSIGQSILDAMKRADYPYIYSREIKEDAVQKKDHKDKLGWKTTTVSRKPMIAELVKAIKEHTLIIYDIRVIEELRVFISNSKGKPEADKGEHDDCVITVAGCVQMHLRCPVGEDFSWDRSDAKPVYAVAAMGAIAPEDDDNDPDGLDLMYENMDEFEK